MSVDVRLHRAVEAVKDIVDRLPATLVIHVRLRHDDERVSSSASDAAEKRL